MKSIKDIWKNKWTKFTFWSILYILLFVVWTGNPWMLFGLPIIYDVYISKIMYRLFWQKHKELKKKKKGYRLTMEWVEAIVFAVIVTSFIKLFVFGMYVIPTSSMEKSLLVGDYLYVSKLRYGPQVPNTPISFPLVHNVMPFSQTKKSYSESIKWDYHRLKGLGKIKRGDVVVFNFPAGDTVVLERQAETYYDILRDYQRMYGVKNGRQKLYQDYSIISRPVDKRENYVKRCVGLPGDTIKIVDAILTVNGKRLETIAGEQHNYIVHTNGTPINQATLSDMGLSKADIFYDQGSQAYYLPLTDANLKRVERMSNIVKITQNLTSQPSPYTFPHDSRFAWNGDNFGPLWVPKKGTTVELSVDNLSLYRTVIENYELHKVDVRGETIFIDGLQADEYTFEMDYFFMLGDNRDNSADSRYWGFVPEDHIVGKASFIWMSTDADKGSFPFNIRWKRLFSKVR